MAKQVMDIHPGTGGMTSAQSNEHLRNWDDRKWEFECRNGNYDRSRAHLNFEIIKGGKIMPLNSEGVSINRRIEKTLSERGIVDPNNKVLKRQRKPGVTPRKYVTVANIIFGGSRDRMLQLAFGNQNVDVEHNNVDHSHLRREKDIENWALDIYNWASKQWGEDNIVGFCVHLDEKNPHIHCSVLPIVEGGRFSYETVFNNLVNRGVLDRYHDELAEINRKWGLDRGDSVAITGARHRSTEEYRRELSAANTALERRNQSLEERKAKLDEEIADLEFRVANGELTLSELVGQLKLAERRVKGLTTMIKGLEEKKAKKEEELRMLQKEGTDRTDAIERKQMELDKIIRDIAYKVNELEAAEKKLKILSDKNTELREHLADIGKKIEKGQSELEQTNRDRLSLNLQQIAGAAYDQIMGCFRNILPTMTAKEAERFEGTVIGDMITHSEDILRSATMLFMGVAVDAIPVSDSMGGGFAGGDGLPWRDRGEDESDIEWARRCFQQACKIVRMANKHKRKR